MRSSTTCGMRALGLSRTHMRTTSAQSSGRIISAGTLPTPGLATYGATKAAVIALTRSLNEELDADGGEVHDPASRLAQERDRRLRHEEEAAQVDGELEIVVLRRQVLDAPSDPDARRVDEHIEAPEPVAMLGDDPLALLRLGDVGRNRRGAELGGRRLDALGPTRDERQLEAFVPQHPGDGEPDARRAAGDECRFWHCAYSKRLWKQRALRASPSAAAARPSTPRRGSRSC